MQDSTSATAVREAVMAMGEKARAASYLLAGLSAEQKNRMILAMAAALEQRAEAILAENAKDVQAAKEKGMSPAMVDRLRLDSTRVAAMVAGVRQVASLPDPVGQVMESWSRPNGIQITQVRVPIGTIGIIYESRPNVTADAAVLCFKTGNATILRGGSEAIRSNVAIAAALTSSEVGCPPNCIQLIPFTDRESVAALAGMDKWLNLLIPRGGKGLIEAVVSKARVPVLKHFDGICHLYVDKEADLEMGVSLTVDSKTQKCSVCNALETLLVHRDVAPQFLPKVVAALGAKKVEVRGCEETRAICPAVVVPASQEDWATEYLDLILSVKVVGSLEEAVAHINQYGSHHTDTIVTEDGSAAEQFLGSVDSACVFHNVSTRFADGAEFGFGAEIGISTDKLHARGPMGLRELTIYKYRVEGTGQTKAGHSSV